MLQVRRIFYLKQRQNFLVPVRAPLMIQRFWTHPIVFNSVDGDAKQFEARVVYCSNAIVSRSRTH
jgi:hypothetical protein